MTLMSGVGTVLLPVAAGLLLEEMTLGGLVRLLLAPWPGNRRRREYKNPKEGTKCSH